MDGAKGLVKQLVLLKFKDDTPIEKIEQLIKGYTNLVTLIGPLKEGTDVSTGYMSQGFTHVFEFIFGSVEDVAAYVAHPAHLEVAKEFSPYFNSVLSLLTNQLLWSYLNKKSRDQFSQEMRKLL
ncbi:stress-response A/B barrel domain-containing protein HS1 isoform X2 [Cinnamomum micranthum f. kanehirae]|uniref:Stress-response A/B barrel domain-containing protein HS1 isoform X2 n=1 Tax=Cinnamomum micranthum f. kanehirae TaxID=337451 RepID=A0A443PWN5_9MAGN|nr:stress-response A/B barrel domain-containing protein HS1 isoform X2 [Cinnamomum micranthum f. kanehirae]